jgi:hypothetical protein
MLPFHRRQECTMTDTPGRRSIWLRGLFMILMAMAFQISGTLLALAAIVQFVLALLSDAPNARLIAFGQSLGLYLSQISDFVSFATEEVPFPFSAWPSSENGARKA